MIRLLLTLLVYAPKVLIVGLLVFAVLLWMSQQSVAALIAIFVICVLILVVMLCIVLIPDKPKEHEAPKEDKPKELN